MLTIMSTQLRHRAAWGDLSISDYACERAGGQQFPDSDELIQVLRG